MRRSGRERVGIEPSSMKGRTREGGRWSARPAALLALVALLVAVAIVAVVAGGPVGRQIGARLLGGLAVSLAIGRVARSRGWLTASGALGAALTGTLVVAGGGATWGALLILFFLSASLLSRLRRRRETRLAAAPAKGARRDLGQVLANGGAALLLQRHRRRQPVYHVHLGHRHLVEEPPRVRRHALQVAALRLGVQRAEGERRLPRARHPREDHERVARDVHVHALQVVLARAAHVDEAAAVRGGGRGAAGRWRHGVEDGWTGRDAVL